MDSAAERRSSSCRTKGRLSRVAGRQVVEKSVLEQRADNTLSSAEKADVDGSESAM